MTLNELALYFNSFLHIENFCGDPSQNGIQIENSNPCEKQITKVAFAVDAVEATAKLAAQAGAQLLFTHHALFWDNPTKLTECMYKRVKPFFDNDMALYSCHIPLDANPVVGNNAGLADRLELTDRKMFSEWRGMTVGVEGYLPKALSFEEVCKKLFPDGEKPLHLFPFGKKEIKKIGIISGGAGGDVYDAWKEGCDCYITGEISHDTFHTIKELEINMIAGGHYQTETVGINLVRAKLEKEKGLETVFIDYPTGL
jgi:dinuclear metal center YbgI/SA1388 family protein